LVADAVPSPEAEIFVLNGMPVSGAPSDRRIRPVLNTLAEIEDWRASAANRPGAAIQIGTGMNRLGLTSAEARTILKRGADFLAPLQPSIIMSHLATADETNHPLIGQQKYQFDQLSAQFESLVPNARKSLSATAGALLGADFCYDLIRPGIGLYGGLPFVDARPVITLSAPIARVWAVEKGETSGYGASWVAKRPSLLATIPLGYADGVPRSLSNRGAAKIAERIVPFAGRVSMDMIVLDVTDLPSRPAVGEIVTLLDNELTVDRMAEKAGTIGYEVLTRLAAQLGNRSVRRYA
jgi:alanine racemase